eukprot:298976-Alexandrium_andersonii.AAC.1
MLLRSTPSSKQAPHCRRDRSGGAAWGRRCAAPTLPRERIFALSTVSTLDAVERRAALGLRGAGPPSPTRR